jgi:hypothetical protein
MDLLTEVKNEASRQFNIISMLSAHTGPASSATTPLAQYCAA